MPRRRPPVEIFSAPVPDHLSGARASCPMCGGNAAPVGWVAERLVFRCADCGVRFKSDGQPHGAVRWAGSDRP
jgi:DNA-directed RNA polymerase subunit RPC12/RpoP